MNNTVNTTVYYIEGPFPYLPGVKVLKAFLKAEARYEVAFEAGRRIAAGRLMKKAKSMMERFKRATGLDIK